MTEEGKQEQANGRRPSRRRFIATAAASAPVVVTLASKPAHAYECTHSALSSGAGSSHSSRRRNPRACYNAEYSSISSHYDSQISAWESELAKAITAGDATRQAQCEARIATLESQRYSELQSLRRKYASYPGF